MVMGEVTADGSPSRAGPGSSEPSAGAEPASDRGAPLAVTVVHSVRHELRGEL